MNTSTIAKLRRKFILVAMGSFFVVILFTGGMTALANQNSIRAQAGNVLDRIIDNDGVLPEPDNQLKGSLRVTDIFEGFSPEYTYAARYFSVLYDGAKNVKRTNVRHIAFVDEQEAVRYADDACRAYEQSPAIAVLDLGMVDTFYYRVRKLENGDTMVAFLDCSFQLKVSQEVGWNTVLICGLGLLGSLLLVLFWSKRAIRPEIENTRKQKQFITNASHELKTPLAVIRANTEVIEMLQGESEWTQSTMSQVDRMDGLVQNLVMIARAEEREDPATMSEVNIAKVIMDSVDPFRALARQENKELTCTVPDEAHLVTDASAIQQLCTILVDNALKYCDPDGQVLVELTQAKHGRATLVVKNTFADGKRAQFNRFFERFYRDDESHSNEGGYGIGLSVAESICARYGGTIKASWKGGMAIFTCQLRGSRV